MLIGFGTGVEVEISVAVAVTVGGRSVAVGAEIVVLRTAGVDRAVVAVATSGTGAAQAENRMAKARIGRVSFFKRVSLTGKKLVSAPKCWDNNPLIFGDARDIRADIVPVGT